MIALFAGAITVAIVIGIYRILIAEIKYSDEREI